MPANPLRIYRRHNPKKCKLTGDRIGCTCPISVYGELHGKTIRQALKTRSWTRAESIVNGWVEEPKRREEQLKKQEAEKEKPVPKLGETVSHWLINCRAKGA